MHGHYRYYHLQTSPARDVLILVSTAIPVALLLLAGCSRDYSPKREDINGIEYVRNRTHPLEGDPLPQPEQPSSLLLLQGGSGGIPAWSAVRDVRAAPDSGWAVIDMHHQEVSWFDRWGNIEVSMDLSRPPLGLTSPVAAAFFETGGGVSIDMALRRVVTFNAEGALLAAFDVGGGLPMDLDLGSQGDLYILTISHPSGGREQVTQVRRYDMAGSPRAISGNDSLLLERRTSGDVTYPIPMSLSVGSRGTLYASGLNYTIHQVLPGGGRRVITRSTIGSRIPDYVVEQRRSLMQLRVESQQREVSLVEDVALVQLVALSDGGVLVQTNEWHPALLDDALNSQVNILLLDQFSEDGSYVRRHAVELPLPRTVVHLTDEDDGFIYGFAVPSTGSGPTTVFRFNLPTG